jgi:hypothetical protein
LAKQLKKADAELQSKEEKQQQHIDLGAKIISEEYFLSNSSTFLKIDPNSKEQLLKTSFIAPFYSFLYIQNCFHPPCMA